jgi:hypothetical protein
MGDEESGARCDAFCEARPGTQYWRVAEELGRDLHGRPDRFVDTGGAGRPAARPCRPMSLIRDRFGLPDNPCLSRAGDLPRVLEHRFVEESLGRLCGRKLDA